jgi:pyridoxal phosphate enzyme (YggS family)
VRERVARAAERSGRAAEAITLVAVTKTWPAEMAQAAVDAGIRVLGENRVQEAQDKASRVTGEVAWHLVGHLQRNKARTAVELFKLIHSVDSLRLATEIDRHARAAAKIVGVLVQVNVCGEATKSGVSPDQAPALAAQIDQLVGIDLRGLMTIGPLTGDERQLRRTFAGLRNLRDQIASTGVSGRFEELSMGMTGDFEAAIEEGATLIRVGTGIFGHRP